MNAQDHDSGFKLNYYITFILISSIIFLPFPLNSHLVTFCLPLIFLIVFLRKKCSKKMLGFGIPLLLVERVMILMFKGGEYN